MIGCVDLYAFWRCVAIQPTALAASPAAGDSSTDTST